MPALWDEKTGDVSVTCDCGKPIVVATEDGMFCEDRCGEKESQAAKESVMALLKMLVPPDEA